MMQTTLFGSGNLRLLKDHAFTDKIPFSLFCGQNKNMFYNM